MTKRDVGMKKKCNKNNQSSLLSHALTVHHGPASEVAIAELGMLEINIHHPAVISIDTLPSSHCMPHMILLGAFSYYLADNLLASMYVSYSLITQRYKRRTA